MSAGFAPSHAFGLVAPSAVVADARQGTSDVARRGRESRTAESLGSDRRRAVAQGLLSCEGWGEIDEQQALRLELTGGDGVFQPGM